MTITILLVDDNPTFVLAVRQFLDRLPGTQVAGEARDGREALALAAKLQPELMLLDIAMPKLNGLEVARAMRSWAHAPRIIFLSMHDNNAYREAARDLGALGFVGKADFVVELLPMIERIVAENSAAGEQQR